MKKYAAWTKKDGQREVWTEMTAKNKKEWEKIIKEKGAKVIGDIVEKKVMNTPPVYYSYTLKKCITIPE